MLNLGTNCQKLCGSPSNIPLCGKQWGLVSLSLGFPPALMQVTRSLLQLSARHYHIPEQALMQHASHIGVEVSSQWSNCLFICSQSNVLKVKRHHENKDPSFWRSVMIGHNKGKNSFFYFILFYFYHFELFVNVLVLKRENTLKR